jgi:hypothetical protein
MDDGVDGIWSVSGPRPVGYGLCFTVLDVADIAARATVCANVKVVRDAEIISFEALLYSDVGAALLVVSGTAGVGLLFGWLDAGSGVVVADCVDGAVSPKR